MPTNDEALIELQRRYDDLQRRYEDLLRALVVCARPVFYSGSNYDKVDGQRSIVVGEVLVRPTRPDYAYAELALKLIEEHRDRVRHELWDAWMLETYGPHEFACWYRESYGGEWTGSDDRYGQGGEP